MIVVKTICMIRNFLRLWYSGNTSACHAGDASSILASRSLGGPSGARG